MAKGTHGNPVKKRGRESYDFPGGAGTPLSRLREEIDHLFDDFSSAWPFRPASPRLTHGSTPFGFSGLSPAGGREAEALPSDVLNPATDVVEKNKEIEVRAELPGLDENDVDVRVSNGSLVISGEKEDEREEDGENGSYYVSERRYGAFKRTIPLPDGIDRDGISAKFRKGVLTVHLPKVPEAQEKARKIEVRGDR